LTLIWNFPDAVVRKRVFISYARKDAARLTPEQLRQPRDDIRAGRDVAVLTEKFRKTYVTALALPRNYLERPEASTISNRFCSLACPCAAPGSSGLSITGRDSQVKRRPIVDVSFESLGSLFPP
jgi:hypothetical protein